jgi:hypothetical protein
MVKKESYEPDSYKKIKAYSPKSAARPKAAVSFPANKKYDSNPGIPPIMRRAPETVGRHEKFQFGTNPMEMTSFERMLVEKEKAERYAVTDAQVKGMQGRDGGEFTHTQFDEEWPDKF